MFRRSSLEPEWDIRVRKPASARPVGSSGPSGLAQSMSRQELKSMNERGGFAQLVKREAKAASVQKSFSEKRSLESWVHVLWMVSRTVSSAATKASKDRVRRLQPIALMSDVREEALMGFERRRERCSRHWRFAKAERASSVRRKHFFSLRRLRMRQPWTR